MNERYLVIKLGGSIVSDRNRYQYANLKFIDHIGEAIYQHLVKNNRNIIVIIGGGGFAHPVLYKATQDESQIRYVKKDMSDSLRILRRYFTSNFINRGINAIGIDINDVCSYKNNQIIFRDEDYRDIMKKHPNSIPVITGGIVSATLKNIEVVSSDDIPLLLANHFDIAQFISLTDVDGVITERNTNNIVSKVLLSDHENTLMYCGENKKLDMTGGMLNKVKNNIQLAKNGIPCFIGSSNHTEPKKLVDSILSGQYRGTYFVCE